MQLVEKLRSILGSHGVQWPDQIDSSVVEFLWEAVNSGELNSEEKSELFYDSIPSIRAVHQKEIEKIIKEFGNKTADVGITPTIAKKSRDKQETADAKSLSLAQKVSGSIKNALESRNLDGADIVEEELVNYLLTSLDELEAENKRLSGSGLSDFRDLLTSFFTEIESDSGAIEQITNILVTAHSERKSLKSRDEHVPPSSSALISRDSSSRSKSSQSEIQSTSDVSQIDDPQIREDISSLMSMMPHTGEDVIRYVYSVLCASNRIEAAQYLVERCDEDGMKRLQLSKSAYDKKEKEAATLSAIQKKKMKDRLCSKYGETVVRDKYDVKGKEIKKKALLPIQFVDVKEKEKKIRYLDDHIVSHRGEKTIAVHRPSDDYDGGSRGKVITKGKRGPGFVMG